MAALWHDELKQVAAATAAQARSKARARGPELICDRGAGRQQGQPPAETLVCRFCHS